MLKRSTRTIVLDLTEGQEKLLERVFHIIDQSFSAQYYHVFEQVYKTSEKLNLEQIAARCYISRHALIDRIEVVNKLIQNTLFFFQNLQIITKEATPIKI